MTQRAARRHHAWLPADLGFIGVDKPENPDDLVTGYKATRARKLTPGRGRPTASWRPDAPPSNTASRT
jgi:hypothetical protein